MDKIVEAISALFMQALQYLYEILVTVLIDTVVQFLTDVVEYFKELHLKRSSQTAFIMRTDKDVNNPVSSLIPDELKGEGIVEGVYNKDTNHIDSLRYIGGNGLSDELKEHLKDNPIVTFN